MGSINNFTKNTSARDRATRVNQTHWKIIPMGFYLESAAIISTQPSRGLPGLCRYSDGQQAD